MTKVKIQIAGVEYTINTNRDQSYVKELSKQINNRINLYMDNNKSMTINHSLILLILEYMDNYNLVKKSEDNLREQINKYIEESDDIRKEYKKLKKEIERLKTVQLSEAVKSNSED